MMKPLDLAALLRGCADDSFDDGIRIDTALEPVAGPGAPVKPALYPGGKYQQDERWAATTDEKPTPVVVIDNVPSQANRLEEALRQSREAASLPEFQLDLSAISNLPVHLPKRISSFQFPHRNADAYLRDAALDGTDFIKTDLGRGIFGATATECGSLMAWFPQALLFGFWQSHLGKKRQNTKHPRAWVSEIVGWSPATTKIKVMGVKGDPLNLSVEAAANYDKKKDQVHWELSPTRKAAKGSKLSDIGHGQVPFTDSDASPAGISFARITQRATVSFAQLRRVSLGSRSSTDTDTAARALLVALGLFAHLHAFGRGFALRSGAELRPKNVSATWLDAGGDQACDLGDAARVSSLLDDCRKHAALAGVPLDGWGQDAVMLTPKANLDKVIRASWPDLND